MQIASIRKWLLALGLLAMILWTIVHFYNLSLERTASIRPIIVEPRDEFAYRKAEGVVTNAQEKAGPGDSQKIAAQKVEEWLALRHRSAASLLAAFHFLDDTNYLKEAATNFPDNPRVALTVLARNAFPGNRRKWLDRFKAASPTNALANYLSAQAYFQNGQSEAAVRDLVAASAKPEFENYATESQLDVEELGLFCGESALKSVETALASVTVDTSQELATIKNLASQMASLQKQELTVNDTDSMENLAELATILGSQLASGSSGKYIANQQAGIAVESMMIEQLNPNTGYDFLGGDTPGQRLMDLQAQAASLSQLIQSFNVLRPHLTGAEKVTFQERVKIYGEIAAINWLLQQHGNPQGGQ